MRAEPRARLFAALALALAGLFFTVTTGLSLSYHRLYASGRHDLEIYLQVLWNTAQGSPFTTTLLKSNELHLAEHLALSLLPLAPLYGLWPDALLTIALQQLLLTAIGIPLWLLARRLLSPAAALAITAGLYLMPAMAFIALDDVHPIAFTAAPLGLAAVLLISGSWRAGISLALATVLVEEEAALPVIGLGLLLLTLGRRSAGISLAGAGCALLLLSTVVIMPGFHHPATLSAVGGNRAVSHFSALLSDPEASASRLLGDRGGEMLVNLLAPTGGTALLAPAALLASAPTVAALFLQDRDDTLRRHWVAPVLPLVWIAACLGLARLRRRPVAARLALTTLCLGSGLTYLWTGPLPGGRSFDATSLRRGPHELDLDQALVAVRPDAAIATSANVAAHLANRREIYVFPIDDHYLSGLRFEERTLDGYVLDLQERDTQRVPPLRRGSPLMANPPFVVWSSGHKVMLLTRDEPSPTIPSRATFNRRMALLGYDASAARGELRLTLYWQKTRDIFADFDRLAEIANERGVVIARDRELPLTAVFPTEKWPVGQIVIDRLAFPLADPGTFTLRLSWLNHSRGTPMPLDSGGDFLELPLQVPPR